jgi:ATP/maltotriose-dependent transcriptional regulator MalT
VRAADFLDRSETMLREQGRVGLLPHVLGMQVQVRVALGDWERAAAAADEGRRLGAETGQPIWTTGSLVSEAMASGLRGDTARAVELAARAETMASSRRLNDYLACARLARSYAWLSGGGYGDAYRELLPLFDPADPSFHQRERFGGVMFLAEAAVHAGFTRQARALLADLEEVAAVTPSPILRVHLLYARAVLADDTDAEGRYLAALGEDLTRWPWPQARIKLAYGSWLRRQRRAAESRVPLRSALTTFDMIGAARWAEQARSELRASGERLQEPRPAPQAALSPQELQIARLAALGLSNRQIGERLYLSPRTVGSHLYRIFPKLEVTSRTQLAARLGTVPA